MWFTEQLVPGCLRRCPRAAAGRAGHAGRALWHPRGCICRVRSNRQVHAGADRAEPMCLRVLGQPAAGDGARQLPTPGHAGRAHLHPRAPASLQVRCLRAGCPAFLRLSSPSPLISPVKLAARRTGPHPCGPSAATRPRATSPSTSRGAEEPAVPACRRGIAKGSQHALKTVKPLSSSALRRGPTGGSGRDHAGRLGASRLASLDARAPARRPTRTSGSWRPTRFGPGNRCPDILGRAEARAWSGSSAATRTPLTSRNTRHSAPPRSGFHGRKGQGADR